MKKVAHLARVLFVISLVAGLIGAASVQAQPIGSGPVLPTKDQSRLIVKFSSDAAVQLQGDGFVAPAAPSMDQLNHILTPNTVKQMQSLVNDTQANIQQSRAALPEALGAHEGDLENYYVIQLAPGQNADNLARQLKALDLVEEAYAKPLPAPAPTPNYVPLQWHLTPALRGMDVYSPIPYSTKRYPGSDGSRVRVVDIEYSWNTAHEDLSHLRVVGAQWLNGTPVDPFNDNNHGTAVAGLVVANHDTRGVNGIARNNEFHTVNANNAERGYDITNAIYLAAKRMVAGDVMLLEQQAWAPDNQGYAPIEIYPDVYDAIRYAVAKGINVVEPAGNGHTDYWGGYNLDSSLFGGKFTTARPNSGAIMVGAGGACGTQPYRSRMAFSNFGSRLDVQGYGECAVTAGYGDLQFSPINSQYTAYFSGTSSASAMIAGVAAQLASSYEQINSAAMTPAKLRAALRANGSAQNTTYNPGNIGPLPNMANAFRLADITQPTTPTNLTGILNASNKPVLSWNASTDNLGVVIYKVYRNGVVLTTTLATSLADTKAVGATSYTYYVVAVDPSGNITSRTNSVTVKTR